MTTEQESNRQDRYFNQGSGLLALWTGLLAAPLAWALQLQIGYSLIPWVCTNGRTFLLHLVTLAALLLAAAGGFIAWRSWQRAGEKWSDGAGGVIPRSRFMAIMGLMMSALFFLLILVQGIPSFIFHPCQR